MGLTLPTRRTLLSRFLVRNLPLARKVYCPNMVSTPFTSPRQDSPQAGSRRWIRREPLLQLEQLLALAHFLFRRSPHKPASSLVLKALQKSQQAVVGSVTAISRFAGSGLGKCLLLHRHAGVEIHLGGLD